MSVSNILEATRFAIVDIFCIDVAMFNTLHDVETIHDLCLLLKASVVLFWNMSDGRN